MRPQGSRGGIFVFRFCFVFRVGQDLTFGETGSAACRCSPQCAATAMLAPRSCYKKKPQAAECAWSFYRAERRVIGGWGTARFDLMP